MKTPNNHLDHTKHSFFHNHHLLIEVIVMLSFLLLLSLFYTVSAY